MNAIALLTDDHSQVEALFQQFEGEADPVRRRDVGDSIMRELTARAEVGEAQMYPAVRGATPGAEELTAESLEEHGRLERLIAQIETMQPEDSGYVPAVLRLKQLVQPGMIAIGRGYETLTEVAHGIKLGRPVVSLESWEIRPPGGEESDEAIHVAESPRQAVDWLLAQLERRIARGGDAPHEITGIVQATQQRSRAG